jgi:nucleotide-binding universal stress UspA family protein
VYRRIVLALDRRGLAESAVPVVAALARGSLAQVVVLSVRDAETDAMPAATTAGAAAAAVAELEAGGVCARAEVLSVHARPVAAVIVEAAHRLGADLVALGSHGRGDLAALLLGSVGHRVAARLDCPVLLVRAGGREARLGPIRRLLVAVDDSRDALGAVASAERLAGEHGADIMVVHSLDDDAVDRDGYGAAQHAAFALLDRAARRLAAPDRTVEARLLTGPGSVAARLAAAAERWDADLIVVGSRRPTDLGGLILGSVGHELVKRTYRPVLLAERRGPFSPVAVSGLPRDCGEEVQ